MNANLATENQQLAHQAFLQEREHLMNEYSRAVHCYQNAVMELNEARKDSISGAYWRLLDQADAAQHALNHCRDRYQNYCALKQSDN